MAGGAGGHGVPPYFLYVGVDVGLYGVVEPGEPGVGGVCLSQRIPLLDEGTGCRGESRLIVVHFSSWYVGFGGLEEDLSEDLLPFGD